jgi:hypothetical protein
MSRTNTEQFACRLPTIDIGYAHTADAQTPLETQPMATIPYALDELDQEHLRALIEAGVGESSTLEFKAAPYSGDHDGTREFLKDTTSFANSGGGLLLVGVEEEDGIASKIAPIALADADKLKQRYESLLQTAVEPRAFGIQLRTVPVSGGCVIAIRVPRSAAPPHRVTAKNSNRIYLRSSAGAYEASMEELRSLFLETATIRDRVVAFRDMRLTEINSGRSPIPLVPGDDRLVLHIFPMSAFSLTPTVDLSKAQRDLSGFRPMGSSMGMNFCFNFLGFLASRAGPPCYGYTQLFREGIVEAVDQGPVGTGEGGKLLYAPHVADSLIGFVPHYLAALGRLGVSPPFFISASLMGVDGATVSLSDRRWSGDRLPLVGDLLLPISVVEDFGSEESYVAALKPALDSLWNAANQAEWHPR